MSNAKSLGISLAMAVTMGAASAPALAAPLEAAEETSAVEFATEIAEEQSEDAEEAAIDALPASVVAAEHRGSAGRLPAFRRLLHAKHVLLVRVRMRVRELRELERTSKRRLEHLPSKKLKLLEMRGRMKTLRATVREYELSHG
jgi:hypothetical protein